CFGSLGAPGVLSVGMDPVVPTHRILQPFCLGEAESLLDARADIGLAYATVQICHEDHRGDLLHQRPIHGLEIRERHAIVAHGWRHAVPEYRSEIAQYGL